MKKHQIDRICRRVPSWIATFLTGGALLFPVSTARATSGTEAASFLDIPVGARPAALGSAYTASAVDAYAPVWNPAGLAQLDSIQSAAMHVPYLQSVNYEFLSVAVPLKDHREGVGFSVQYLDSGDIERRDETGDLKGNYSATFSAYTLAYGFRFSDRMSLGAAAKYIQEKILDVSGHSYAGDVGLLYQASDNFRLGLSAANMGKEIKLVSESDPLPLAFRGGFLWNALPEWALSGEAVYRRTGLFSGSVGGEYKFGDIFALRTGYDSSHVKGLSAIAGLRAGIAISFKGQEFSYAVAPFGDLGTSQYFSLLIRFTTKARPDQPPTRTLLGDDESPQMSEERLKDTRKFADDDDKDFNLKNLLNDKERKAVWPR